METKPKVLLAATILFTAAGLLIEIGVVNVAKLPSLHVVLPMGAIFAGMFLVSRLFEKESRVPVDDQQRALKKAGMDVPRSETPAKQGAILAQ